MNSTETILVIILMILIGYISKKIGLLKPEDSITLNKIVINIAIPALISLAMYGADLSNIKIILPITLICIVAGILSGFVVYIFSRTRGYSKKNQMDTCRDFNSF